MTKRQIFHDAKLMSIYRRVCDTPVLFMNIKIYPSVYKYKILYYVLYMKPLYSFAIISDFV